MLPGMIGPPEERLRKSTGVFRKYDIASAVLVRPGVRCSLTASTAEASESIVSRTVAVICLGVKTFRLPAMNRVRFSTGSTTAETGW